MNNNKIKVIKQDIWFLLALAFCALASASRFYDEKLNAHTVSFEILKSEQINLIAMLVYYILQLLFCFVCSVVSENKKNVYYLAAFLSVFTFPMFWSASYFGTMDMYGWMMAFLCGCLIVLGKAEWLVAPLCFFMTLLCPMAIYTCGCMILVLLVYKALWKKKKRYVLWAVFSGISIWAGKMQAGVLGNTDIDAQDEVVFSKFILMLICMSPYLLIALLFLVGLIRKNAWNKKIATLILGLGVFPSAVVYIQAEDYGRAVFYVFTYFIFITITLLSMQDNEILAQLEETKDKIKEYFPIPVLIIAYPLLFMSLWIAGAYVPLKETFISK